ncbi:MAG: hypothetical protein C0603_00700 [Denitrovibrio sp.]|nr:MAG: hypothetical protein C0603_00700 [Denitrovibrio sp.]
MIERINTQVTVSVDKATKKAADALEKVTNRLVGDPDNAVDRGVNIRLNAQYSENYLQARNAQDSISYHQTRDGYLGSITDMTLRLRDLSVQMGNPILNDSDKSILQQEANMIMQDIDSMSEQAEFNTHKLISDVNTSSLGLKGLDIGADGAIAIIDNALQQVNSKRAETGATMTTLEARIDNLAIHNENLSAAIEARSGSFLEDVVEMTESLNKALIAVKAADMILDLSKDKVSSLLDMK